MRQIIMWENLIFEEVMELDFSIGKRGNHKVVGQTIAETETLSADIIANIMFFQQFNLGDT